MNAERLFALYDRVADALDAADRLRRFVLDLAVRGKLVEQDPADEPASELLAQARCSLRNRARSTKRVRWKETDPVAPEEIQGKMPSGWVAGRVNDTGLYVNGLAFKPADWKQSGTPIIRIQNLTDPTKGHNLAEGDFPDEVSVQNGDLLVSWSATLEAFRWDRGEGVLNQHIFRVIPDDGLTTRGFLLLLLKAAIRQLAESDHAHGLVMKHINRAPFLNHVVLIPPLAEQRRIVAKVDELMALCDRGGETRTAREDTRDRLTKASLNRLTAPDTEPKAFRAHARFAVNALPALTARADQVKHLRQTILSLAVRGKLVAQERRLTPVATLLANRGIRVSGSRWFEIPETWAWVKVRAVAESRLGKMLDKSKNTGDSRRYLRNVNVRWFDFDLSDVREMRFEDAELPKFALRAGDVLICEGGKPGRAAVWDEREDEIYFQKAIHRVRFLDIVDGRYFVKALRASADEERLAEYFTGTTFKHFTGTALRAYVFPLPPLAEQHRIVAKVDELMALCDRLEDDLGATAGTRNRLLESLLQDTLAPSTYEAATAGAISA